MPYIFQCLDPQSCSSSTSLRTARQPAITRVLPQGDAQRLAWRCRRAGGRCNGRIADGRAFTRDAVRRIGSGRRHGQGRRIEGVTGRRSAGGRPGTGPA